MFSPHPLPAFALAKIRPPRPRAGLVERPALDAALAHALANSRLTLLLAPAGFGKTAALTRQFARLAEVAPPTVPLYTSLAWLSADDDDDLPRFLAGLAAALEPCAPPWRAAPDALGAAGRSLRDMAGEIVNALAGSSSAQGWIVIDDAQRVVDPRVFELLQAMLERLPPSWSLVIASRVAPPMALARWRAAGELAEFLAQDLAFDEAGIDALRSVSLPAGAATPSARELLERTGGWPAAVRLCLAPRPGVPPQRLASVVQRQLFDYLEAEVLADLPAGLGRLLQRSALGSEAGVASLARVGGDAQAARWLEQIDRRGLAASVDGDHRPVLHAPLRAYFEDRRRREYADARLDMPQPAVARAAESTCLSPALPAAANREVATLTDREREVLARLAAGGSNKVIARAFALSPHTVKRHVANILGKLGAQSRVQAAAHWREHANA